jgi:hypothetical protein
MDPYLEQEAVWHDFHEKFLPAASAQLVRQVRPRYVVLIDEHVYLRDLQPESPEAPAHVVPPNVGTERLSYLEIRDRVDREQVAVVELLRIWFKTTSRLS